MFRITCLGSLVAVVRDPLLFDLLCQTHHTLGKSVHGRIWLGARTEGNDGQSGIFVALLLA